MAADVEYFKVMRREECHHGLQYTDGLNVDPRPWSTETECSAGGIYFARREELPYWMLLHDDMAWIRSVTLPPDARVHAGVGKSKADRVVLGPRQPIADWCAAQTAEWQLAAVRANPNVVKYMQDRPEVCLAAVQESGDALRYVQAQTPELCLAGVRLHAFALSWVKQQTPELCLAAVQLNAYALQFVKVQTHEICLAALRENANVLHLVKPQTPELCLAAVQLDPVVLYMVKQQTPEICMAAVQMRGATLQFVKVQTRELCLAAIADDWKAIYYCKDVTDELRAASNVSKAAHLARYQECQAAIAADANAAARGPIRLV